MDHLWIEANTSKAKALDDAKQTQRSITTFANKAGIDLPKYTLEELVGKGSFGRVYKAKDSQTSAIVAIKIIDIDKSDTIDPQNADSCSDFLKEVSALRILSENKARNINHVIEALPVGHTVWMVTEYCGGGSVATLMKPTPRGLQEKWIVPILREVVEALKWVHGAGANVLVTEDGRVQLCDFGVAGIIETQSDKRSTFIGTLHWMAPEMFDSTLNYGKEVDIWAFGCMVYEVATGLPPNVGNAKSPDALRACLRDFSPRLGEPYTAELRSLVSYCLEKLPGFRPSIDQVQQHPYIYNTSSRYPTSTLSHLVRAFRSWEYHGGNRKSLFMPGGAPGPIEIASSQSVSIDEWNFSTTASLSQEVETLCIQDVYNAYDGPPQQRQLHGIRRRLPPRVSAPLKDPLEKLFDPNTISNYDANSRSYYSHSQDHASDLPLRDNSTQTSVRHSLLETVKPGESSRGSGFNADRTQDWKFPSLPTGQSCSTLHQRPSPPYTPRERLSVVDSLIDLDVSLPNPMPTFLQSPTAGYPYTSTDRSSVAESLIDLDASCPSSMSTFSQSPTGSYHTKSPATDGSSQGGLEPEHHMLAERTISSGPFLCIPGSPLLTSSNLRHMIAQYPGMPAPPSVAALTGTASQSEMSSEMIRLLSGLQEQLKVFRSTYSFVISTREKNGTN